jgi:tripartite-type tricarboxylate transporter receptor subunit TctC
MRKSLLAAAAAALLAAAPFAAQAQSEPFPNRQVKLVVPYAPGGATDIVARVLADRMRVTLGQPVVVENKTGAFGILAMEEILKGRPDGHTLMVGNVSTNAITPIIYKDKMKFDYETQITAVARLAVIPAFVGATTAGDFKPQSLKELIDYAKKNPGKVRYTSAGIGSYPHYDAAIFAKRAGFDSVHVPARTGAAGMVGDLSNGDVHWAFINVASVAGLVRAGTIKPLAVITDKRMPEFPDVPTMTELGFAGIGTFNWQGLFAPAGTPADVQAKIAAAVNDALASDDVKAALARAMGTASPTASPAEAQAWLKSEIGIWRKFVAEADIKLE